MAFDFKIMMVQRAIEDSAVLTILIASNTKLSVRPNAVAQCSFQYCQIWLYRLLIAAAVVGAQLRGSHRELSLARCLAPLVAPTNVQGL